jgi:hypothetical protein
MIEVSQFDILEAWSAWSSGGNISQQILWGISIQWWGRVGKFMQLLAGLTIVAEIVGSERLRHFGQSLHGALTYLGLKKRLIAAVRLIGDQLIYMVAQEGTASEARERIGDSELARFNTILVPILVVVLTYWGWRNDLEQIWLVAAVSFIASATMAPFIVAISVMIASVLGLLIDTLFIEPVAWLVERPRLERSGKVLSIALLLIGFHFDLLAS